MAAIGEVKVKLDECHAAFNAPTFNFNCLPELISTDAGRWVSGPNGFSIVGMPPSFLARANWQHIDIPRFLVLHGILSANALPTTLAVLIRRND